MKKWFTVIFFFSGFLFFFVLSCFVWDFYFSQNSYALALAFYIELSALCFEYFVRNVFAICSSQVDPVYDMKNK